MTTHHISLLSDCLSSVTQQQEFKMRYTEIIFSVTVTSNDDQTNKTHTHTTTYQYHTNLACVSGYGVLNYIY